VIITSHEVWLFFQSVSLQHFVEDAVEYYSPVFSVFKYSWTWL